MDRDFLVTSPSTETQLRRAARIIDGLLAEGMCIGVVSGRVMVSTIVDEALLREAYVFMDTFGDDQST